MGEAHPAVEGIPVSAAQNAEAVAGPAAAQLPGAEALPLQPSGPNVVVQPTHDRKRSLQLEHSLGHAPQKGNRDSSEPEKAAPARASRRLEARRWARCRLHTQQCLLVLATEWRDVAGCCDCVARSMQANGTKLAKSNWRACVCREGGPEAEAEGEAGEVNILALLRPFLTRQPPSREGTLLLAPPAHSAAPPSAVPATPSGQERAAEERAVRAYLAASGEAPSVLAAGAKLLCAVAQQKGQPWPCDLAKQMLSLAAVLCPSWKPEGGMHPAPLLNLLARTSTICHSLSLTGESHKSRALEVIVISEAGPLPCRGSCAHASGAVHGCCRRRLNRPRCIVPAAAGESAHRQCPGAL